MQPGQQKITQFDEVTSTQSGDIIPIVRGGQNKRISVENFTGVIPDGWVTPAEVWTFSSFGNNVGVITVPEGSLSRYPINTRVWFKQGTPTPTNKYGVVISSTATSITIRMLNETVLQNLTIQQPVISSIFAPGTPDVVDFSSLPKVAIYNNVNQSITNTSGVAGQLNAPQTLHNINGATGTNSIIVTETGIYEVTGEVRTTDVENFFATIARNGTEMSRLSFAGRTATSRGYAGNNGSRDFPLSAGDVLTLRYENRALATTVYYSALSIAKRA